MDSNSFSDFHPFLLVPTVIYLSSKIEECAIRVDHVIDHFIKIGADRPLLNSFCSKLTGKHILECEFFLLEVLSFDLIIYHPYKSIELYLADMLLLDECMQLSWFVINCSGNSFHLYIGVFTYYSIDISYISFMLSLDTLYNLLLSLTFYYGSRRLYCENNIARSLLPSTIKILLFSIVCVIFVFLGTFATTVIALTCCLCIRPT
jgi:hypothetical protein